MNERIGLKEAAELTGLSRGVLARWCRAGVLKTAAKLDSGVLRSEWLVDRDELTSERIQTRVKAALYHGGLVREGLDRS